MLGRANEFTSTIAEDNMDTMEKYLKAFNAFKEHDKAKLKIIRDVEETKLKSIYNLPSRSYSKTEQFLF